MRLRTVEQIDRDLAGRVKKLRRRKHFTQKEFAEKCNISYGAYKLFEQTGKISFTSLTQIAVGLGREDEIDRLFSEPVYDSIDEVVREYKESEQSGRKD